MMAIANYKVVQEFEYDGKMRKLGEEIVLTEKEGEKLVQASKLVVGRYLDPEDKDDVKKMKDAEVKYSKKSAAAQKKEDDRDAKKDTELKVEDEEKAAEEAAKTAEAEAERSVEESDETEEETEEEQSKSKRGGKTK